MSKNKSLKFVFADPEFWAIFLFNGFIIYSYYIDVTSAKSVIALYYVQSILIGLQTFIRMIASGLNLPAKTPFSGRFGTALFFAFHYGMFHLIYFVFIIVIIMNMSGSLSLILIAGASLFMLLNMIMSLFSDIRRDRSNFTVPGAIMFQPYLRIAPMHLFIIIGFNEEREMISRAFVIFIILKTVADILMHIVVNQTYIRRRPKAVEGWI